MSEEGEIIEFLTISLARITGTMLLAVYNYNSARGLVSRSALGTVLLILSVILGHIGIQKKFSPDPLIVSLCFTVSALWSNSGIIQLLVDNKILSASLQFREALFPGLLAVICGFLIIGCVGTFQNKGPISLMSFALGLANIHVLALFNNQYIGSSGIGCNFMIVTIISLYLVAKRFVNILTNKKMAPPAVNKDIYINSISSNTLVATGILSNMMPSSVLCGKLVGTSSLLFIGQAHWMFTSAAYQIAVFAASFWAKDILNATFFSLLVVLRFAEGFSLLNQTSSLSEPLIPPSFMAVLAVLFFALSFVVSLHNVYTGLYTFLYAIYCATLIFHSGINHTAAQTLNLIIFLASMIHMFLILYLTETDFKLPERKRLVDIMFSCHKCLRTGPERVTKYSYAFSVHSPEVDVIGHAFNSLASFSMTMPKQGTFMLLMAAGCMVHIAGFMSLSRKKSVEGSAFIFYGVLWVTWGFVKYVTSYEYVRGFYIALGIICFSVLNGFVTACMAFHNKAWFLNSLLLETLLICSLLQTLNILPAECIVAVSILFGIGSFYCFLTALVNGTLGRPYLPWGEPFLKPELLQQSCNPRLLPASKVTSIHKIAEIMNSGGLCIIPVDLGYVIASSCRFLDSIHKVSKASPPTTTNACHGSIDLALELDMVYWSKISALQLLYTLFLTFSCDEFVGPIAVRKLGRRAQSMPGLAFPKLLGQTDGILLDDAQNSDFEFTIIDCMELHEGVIEIIKEGSVPKAKVMDVLHSVITREENGIRTLNSDTSPFIPFYRIKIQTEKLQAALSKVFQFSTTSYPRGLTEVPCLQHQVLFPFHSNKLAQQGLIYN
ncbi:uncharacterized protein PAF06_000064 [Gastrophryne carolinensis]